jgi:hypothetical protein
MNIKETKKSIIQAGRKAVNELIKVAEEKIITNTEDDVSADRLKNAAATKKLLKDSQKVDLSNVRAKFS